MRDAGAPIKNFVDLRVWQTAHAFVLLIYKNSEQFPVEERFGLINQLRRAGVSVTSNIAEGFGRFSFKEKVQFYLMARGSLTEVQNQLFIARDVHYLSVEDFSIMYTMSVSVARALNALIRTSRSKIF